MQKLRLESSETSSSIVVDRVRAPGRAGGLPTRSPARTSTRAAGPLNVVLICHFGRTGYNILRALRMSNARVYLIRDDRSVSLQLSRYCKVVHAPPDLRRADPEPVIKVINDLHLRVGIDRVIASDVESLTLLAQIEDRLLAPAFPMATAPTLAKLNNKWEFNVLCESVGVAAPKTLLFNHRVGLDWQRILHELGLPVIVKPVDSYGQRGISILRHETELRNFVAGKNASDGIDVVQEYIAGQDWALSVFAREGVVEHWASWVCPSQLDVGYGIGRFLATHFCPRDDLLAMGKKIVAATNFSGVANFDGRFDEKSGSMKMFECNPRFFNRMSAARLCGLDFVRPGLPFAGTQPAALGDQQYYPWQELFSKRGLKRLVRGEWQLRPLMRDFYEMGTDPLPPIVRKIVREDQRD